MRRWRLPVAVSGTYASSLHGLITFDFPEGVVTPASEGEELVLEEVLSKLALPVVTDDVVAEDAVPAEGSEAAEDETDGEPAPPPDVRYMADELAPAPDDPRLAAKATREQLLEYATELGVDVPEGATKADIRELIETAGVAGEEA